MPGIQQCTRGDNVLQPTKLLPLQPPVDRLALQAVLYLANVISPNRTVVYCVPTIAPSLLLRCSYRVSIQPAKNHEIPEWRASQHNKQIAVEFPCRQALIQPG